MCKEARGENTATTERAQRCFRMSNWRPIVPSGPRVRDKNMWMQWSLSPLLGKEDERCGLLVLPEECCFPLDTQLVFLKEEKEPTTKMVDDDEWIQSLTEAEAIIARRS